MFEPSNFSSWGSKATKLGAAFARGVKEQMGTTFLATQRLRSASNILRLPENTSTAHSTIQGNGHHLSSTTYNCA
jgi:hypothetical protein